MTGEKKYVTVDFFLKWRIDNVAAFYRSTGGGRIADAENRLEQLMKDGLRNEFSRRTIQEALSGERGNIIQGLESKSKEVAKQLGVEIIDVRVSRIDFPDTVSESVYNRMRSDRERVAQDFRSRGQEEGAKAYQQDPEFYSFYRSLNAYRNTIGKNGDIMVLEPNSEFFRYFRQQSLQ